MPSGKTRIGQFVHFFARIALFSLLQLGIIRGLTGSSKVDQVDDEEVSWINNPPHTALALSGSSRANPGKASLRMIERQLIEQCG
jgi:hypothetical protein